HDAMTPPGLSFPVAARGDEPTDCRTQYAADGLDPELIPVLVDVLDHFVVGRSSSAAKKADAVLRISLARFNSLFSRRNRLSSSSSALVGPSSRWATRRACLSHVRNVCGETPSFSPTAVAAPLPLVS